MDRTGELVAAGCGHYYFCQTVSSQNAAGIPLCIATLCCCQQYLVFSLGN